MRFLLIAFLFVTGCDRIDKATMQLADFKEQTVVLSSQPFQLDQQGRTFTTKEQMRSIGGVNACVVLKAHYPMTRREQMDRDYEVLLKGAKLSATLTATNGQTYQLDNVGQAWDMYGPISSSEELSACISCACGPKIPEGMVIQSIHIESDKPLSVLGAYWHSMPMLDVPKG